jgi:23S rRNA (adenine2503-C2)-methyltransferase
VAGLSYRRPTQQAQADFLATLRGAGVSVTVRKRKGADIDAACGQLRRAALAHAGPTGERREGESPLHGVQRPEPVPATRV